MLLMTIGRFRRRTDLLGARAILNVNQFGAFAISEYFPQLIAHTTHTNVNQFGGHAIALVPETQVIATTALANVNQFGSHEISIGEPVSIAIAQETLVNSNQFGSQEIALIPPPNSAAAFVNRGTHATQAFGASVAPAYPASLATGNILIGVVACAVAGGARAFTWPAGWNVIEDHAGNGTNCSVAYRIVDGSEGSSITITWTGGNTSAGARMFQYHGNLPSSPLGNHTEANSDTATTTWALGSINASAVNSLMIAVLAGNTSLTVTQPSGWSQDSVIASEGQAHIYVCSKTVAASGDPSGAISTSKANVAHASCVFEIKAN